MRYLKTIKTCTLISIVIVSGCATSNIKENSTAAVLEPMERPALERQRFYQLDKKTGEERFYERTVLREDGTYSGVNNNGCQYEAMGDLVSPALSWSGCNGNPKWSSGENKNMEKQGEIWPLKVGNQVSYRYTQVNALGEEQAPTAMKCKVLAQVNIDVASGNHDAFKVRCIRRKSDWSATRIYYFSPELGVELKFVKSTSSKGVETDYEYLRTENL